MGIFVLFLGLFTIGIGFLVGKYPSLISGYNTMSAEKMKNIDMKAIASLYKKGMFISGVVMTISSSIFSLLRLSELLALSLIFPLLIGLLIISLLEQKYNQNKRSELSKKGVPIFLGILSAAIAIGLFSSSSESKVIFSDDNIEFTGDYGIIIKESQIKEVKLLNEIPSIHRKINGFNFGDIMKGNFLLSKFGKCQLFIRLSNPPYLYVELKYGGKILFNSRDSLYTKEVYEKLKK